MAKATFIISTIRSALQQKEWARAVFNMSEAHNIVPDFMYEELKLEVNENDDLIVIDDSGNVHYISTGVVNIKIKESSNPEE